MARRLFLGSKLFQRPFRVQLGDQCLEFYKTCLRSSPERLLLDRQRQEIARFEPEMLQGQQLKRG